MSAYRHVATERSPAQSMRDALPCVRLAGIDGRTTD